MQMCCIYCILAYTMSLEKKDTFSKFSATSISDMKCCCCGGKGAVPFVFEIRPTLRQLVELDQLQEPDELYEKTQDVYGVVLCEAMPEECQKHMLILVSDKLKFNMSHILQLMKSKTKLSLFSAISNKMEHDWVIDKNMLVWCEEEKRLLLLMSKKKEMFGEEGDIVQYVNIDNFKLWNQGVPTRHK